MAPSEEEDDVVAPSEEEDDVVAPSEEERDVAAPSEEEGDVAAPSESAAGFPVACTVTDFDLKGLPGVVVSVIGAEPPLSTTSGPDGTWSLVLPPGPHFVEFTKEGYWGVIRRIDPVSLPQDDNCEDTELPSHAERAETLSELGREMDMRTAAVVVSFHPAVVVGGESATLSVESSPPFVELPDEADESFDTPMESDAILRESTHELTFTGIDPAAGPVTIEVHSVAGETRCALWHGEIRYPLRAGHSMHAEVNCEVL